MSENINQPRFTPEQCEELLFGNDCSGSELPVEKSLDKINQITEAFLSAHYFQNGGQSPSSIRKRFSGLAGRAKELTRLIKSSLKTDKELIKRVHQLVDDLKTATHDIGLKNLPTNITQLQNQDSTSAVFNDAVLTDVIQYCDHITQRNDLKVKRNKRDGKASHQPDIAFKSLIGDLVGLWMDVQERIPGVTVDHHSDNNPISGPIIDFLQGYFRILREHLGPDILDSDIELKFKLLPTDEALRERIRTLKLNRLNQLPTS